MNTLKRPFHEIPDFVLEVLYVNNLMEHYLLRPPYQRNDYIGWISRAKREETKQKRLNQMLSVLSNGEKYMGMEYQMKLP